MSETEHPNFDQPSPDELTLRAIDASQRLLESQPQQYHAELLPPVTHESYFGGEVRVIEASPMHPQTGEAIKTDKPDVYYAHGAGWAQEEPTVQEMARRGRRAFAMDFTGARLADARFVVGHTELGNTASLQDVTDKEAAALLGELDGIVPRQQMREAATLLGLIAERRSQDPATSRIDAVFQSESAGHGIIAAYTHPEAFHNIVLAFPGSLSGPQTGFIPLRIAKDGVVRRQHRPSPDNDFRSQDQLGPAASVRAQLKSPGFKEDAAALRYSALAWMLHSMRQREDAPGVTLVAGLDDKIFELEGYLNSLVAPTDIDRIVVVPGGHAIGGRKDILATVMDQLPAMESGRASGPLKHRIFLPANTPAERVERIMALADEIDRRGVEAP
jgi:hypothetical protein